MKIVILPEEREDFITVAQEVTGGGFSYKYQDGEMWLSINNPLLENWKTLPEYTALKREQKLQAKLDKENKKLLWGEVKKNKDGDLDVEDLAEVDKKLGEL